MLETVEKRLEREQIVLQARVIKLKQRKRY
jgi:hypothetical protein